MRAVRSTCRWAGFIALAVAITSVETVTVRSQDADDLARLVAQISRLYGQGRYGEATPLAERYVALARQKHDEESNEFAGAIVWLAVVYAGQGRYAEAEPLYKRALAIREKALGPDHLDVGQLLHNLAVLYRDQGRYAEAEPLHKRVLSIAEKALGSDHPVVATAINGLGALYWEQGRYADAEPLFKRALAIREKALGPNHRNVGESLNNLAEIFRKQGRYAEAEPLRMRVLAIAEKALGSDHPQVGSALSNLALLYYAQGRYTDAEPLYKRALAISEKALGPDHPLVGTSLNNLALLYFTQGRYAEVEPLYKRALAISEKALGPDHPEVGTRLSNLSALYRSQGRYSEADSLQQRDLAIIEKALGPDHPSVGNSLNNRAGLYFVQRDWALAADFLRRSTAIVARRAQRGTADVGQAVTGKRKSEAEQQSGRFVGLVKAGHRLAPAGGNVDAGLTDEMFQTAQWAQSSEAAQSLALMAARGAKGDPALGHLIRERQDLVGEWQDREKQQIAAVSRPPDKRYRETEAANVARLAEIDTRIAEIDQRLKAEFPDYAALGQLEPLSVAEVQAELRADEALVLFLDTAEWKPTPEETFIWVITKTDARWVRSELGTPSLTSAVSALRCGLDAAAWEVDDTSTCAGLLKLAAPNRNAPLPFDVARAHELYQSLFGQVEDLINAKQLLIVPSGPLTALPFQVLVTAPQLGPVISSQGANSFSHAAWLAKRHAITVLPSVASLKSLRQFAKISKAKDPFVGFGNPLITGPNGDDIRAWEHQACTSSSAPTQIGNRSLRGAIAKFFRGGLANIEEVRAQYPLPETADELCAVAQLTGAGPTAVYLGEKASEKTIKALSANGLLAQSRVVHFATHGLLAGETEMLTSSNAEPALLFSPPAQATEEDDGLLTASEITQLKLDADWVVLSACNTAAAGSDKPGAEALSGLARAFFYAGARALLVSHWAVNSNATVKLITKAFDEIKADPMIGRAEALRRSMLHMIDNGSLYEAHPSYWAPFVVVGEGAPTH